MALVEINWQPTDRELHKFGVTMIIGFAIIGLVVQFALQQDAVAYVCYALGAMLGVLGLSGRPLGLLAYRAWMAVAYVLGNVISRVLLALIYFGLFMPMAMWRRLVGNDPLRLRRLPCDSYWTSVGPPTDGNRAERQF
jgi:hypothetical protein